MTDVPVTNPGSTTFVENFDAPLSARREHLGVGTTVGADVTGPGRAPTVGAGERRARRRSDTEGEDNHLRHNWVPIGPRNVGGRIRSMVVHPTDPNTLYAGGASGGVWKTIDAGQSWFALWHDEPALAIGGMAICRDHPNVVWAATGEHGQLEGAGIWRSTDDGASWANPARPLVPPSPAVPADAGLEGTGFEAIAAHPTDIDRAWAVGANGVFRTSDGGLTWKQFRAGEHWSDVAYSTDTAGGMTLFLVRAVSDAGEGSIVVLPQADDTDANIEANILLPGGAALPAAHVSTVIAPPPPPPPDPPPRPAAGVIAIASDNPARAYVRFAGDDALHRGVFRSTNAQLAPPDTGDSVTWTRLLDAPRFATEGQGGWNLSMAVTPDGEHIATGMIDLHVLRTAHTAPGPPGPAVNPWRKAMAAEIWPFDPAHHADQHTAAFAAVPGAPAGTLQLWSANDGGISVSRDWDVGIGHDETPEVPLPAGAISWDKRVNGLTAAQMYDLGQSPIVPGMIGCGFQDNGVYVTEGGPTWTFVLGADGGHVAFDPDDPYRFLATWHNSAAIAEIHVPGLLRSLFEPTGGTLSPWPRSLDTGFTRADLAQFVSETVHHPSEGRSVFHARRNTVYRRSRTRGEVWQPAPLGNGIELRIDTTNPTAALEVLPSTAAGKLGLVPQRMVRANVTDRDHPHAGHAVARCHSLLDAPYRLADGDRLTFRIDGLPPQTVIFRAGQFADISSATAAEVAAAINGVAAGVAQSVCLPSATSVQLVAKVPGTTLTLGGSATLNFFVGAGSVTAEAGHHAVATLHCSGDDLSNTTLTVQLGAGPAAQLDMNDLPRPTSVLAADLARFLRERLDVDKVGVGLHDLEQRVRLTHTGGGNVTETGTARSAGPLTLTPPPPPPPPTTDTVTGTAPFGLQSGGPPFTLVVGDGTNSATVTFDPALGVADLQLVSAHELRRVTAAAIASVPPASRPTLRVDLELDVEHREDWSTSKEGAVTEIAFSAGHPDHVWAGDNAGYLHRSSDGGSTWTTIVAPGVAGRLMGVEGLVVHPTEPQRVLVGLEDRPGSAQPREFVFRTTDGGASWSHVGGDLVAGEGQRVGTYGLEVDPDEPGVVWAATAAGVFRSADFGGTWQAYNHGLPNAEVRDVVFEPVTRTLKVGLWGRGVWERHVGDRPPEDVALLVRSTLLDNGRRPPLRGADALAVPPGPAVTSPDIKVTRRIQAAAAGPLLDGVELDSRIEHERPALGPSTLCVQVHNRGAFPTANVRVTSAWAPLVDGRPPRLAREFFLDRAAGDLTVDSVHGGWQVIGDGTIPSGGAQHDVVSADHPRVHRVAYSWPAAAIDAGRIAIVAVVTGDGDGSLPGEGEVDDLVASHRKIGVRVTDTITADEDRRIVLRSRNGRPFRLLNPTGGVGPAAVLGLPLGGPAAPLAVSTAAASFNLGAGAPRGFRIQHDAARTVTFDGPPDIADLSAAAADEVATVLDRDLVHAGVPVRGGTAVVAGNTHVGITALGAARTRIVAPSTAAGPLGLVPGGALARFDTGMAASSPFNLSIGSPLSLNVEIRFDHQVSFPAATGATPAGTPEIANLAASEAHEIRAAINRQLAHTGIPVVAEPATIEVVVRRTLTESVRGGVIGGEQYADLVVSAGAVAAADRPALFDLVTVLQADRAARDSESRVYVRSANRGNIPVAAVRHRLWSIDPAGPVPYVAQAIGGEVNAPLGPESTTIVEFRWNPGAVDAGHRLLLLLIADRHPDAVLDPPADFPTLAAVHSFCAVNANAATRLVEVRP